MSEFDLTTLLQQARGFQERLKQLQEEMALKTVEAQAGAGMVRVVVDGALHVRKIELDPALLAANDKAMIEDLVVVAVNEALGRAQEMVASQAGMKPLLDAFNLTGKGEA